MQDRLARLLYNHSSTGWRASHSLAQLSSGAYCEAAAEAVASGYGPREAAAVATSLMGKATMETRNILTGESRFRSMLVNCDFADGESGDVCLHAAPVKSVARMVNEVDITKILRFHSEK